jgi:acyl-CoA synthetase (AMP-forming)/AMP-acid ligase II
MRMAGGITFTEIGPEPTVRDLLDARAARFAGHTALIAPSLVSGAEEERFSYARLRGDAGRLASALAAAGVGKGDRVGILLTNDAAAEAHVTYHASHRLGAINVPLNTRYVARELRYVLEFTAPSAIVFEPRFGPLLESLRGALGGAALIEAGPAFAALMAGAGPEPPPVALDADDDADWIFTSGTTGNPKAVALSHRGSVVCGYQSIGMWGLSQESVYQSFAPFFTSTGCHSNLLACLAAGCTYVVEPEFQVHATLDRMARHGTTSTFLISTVLALILDRLTPAELDAYDFPALRRVCYGGQSSSPAFYRRVWTEIGERWGVDLYNIYGLTEGGTSGLMLSHEDHPAALARMGSYGLSVGRTGYRDWIEHTILEPDGTPAAPGAIGELCLRGPSTMSRYVANEEATRAALRDGWLHTGDTATRDADGFVYFVDRDKQLIRRGGLNISSAEVEGVLLEHPGVVEAAAVPLPNPVLGADVRAVVVLRGDPPPSAGELIAFCAQRLADYKVPVQVDVIDALPRNAMNRVMKGVLTGDEGALA